MPLRFAAGDTDMGSGMVRTARQHIFVKTQ